MNTRRSITRASALNVVKAVLKQQDNQHGDDPHSVAEWILIIQHQLRQAQQDWCNGYHDEAVDRLTAVSACAIQAIQQYG